MSDPDHPPSPEDSEAVFDMDPQAVLIDLSRRLVDGHAMLVQSRRAADQAARLRSVAPEEVQAFRNTAQRYEDSWRTSTLPALLASMKLALEVYDTFGPGHTHIEDATEAAIWNNKWFVWAKEFDDRAG
jgi:hypothetical protein